MRMFILFISAIMLMLNLSCGKETKPVSDKGMDLSGIREPSAEEEKKIKLSINFDGQWKKESAGSKAIIIIKGKAGRIVGRNGAEIPIIVKYMNPTTVKIFEYNYNPEYLSNWLPDDIAKAVYNSSFLKKTYSMLRIIDEDTLRGTSYAWQVYHNNNTVQRIEPLVSGEEWKRIKK